MTEKEIDKWAIHAALVDLHFQTDSVRKCAAVNDLLERAERDQFQITRLIGEVALYKKALNNIAWLMKGHDQTGHDCAMCRTRDVIAETQTDLNPDDSLDDSWASENPDYIAY